MWKIHEFYRFVWQNQRGTITIYLVIIFVAMVIFIGALVDLTRIKIAQNQLSRSVNASARSVLADYDTKMKKDFRLFAYGKNEHQEAFRKYLQANLSMSENQSFKLLDYRLEDVQVQMLNPLTQQEVLKNQILADMKYRAPIELTKLIADKFGVMGKLHTFVSQQRQKSKILQSVRIKLKEVNKAKESIDSNRALLVSKKLDLKSRQNELKSITNAEAKRDKEKELADLQRDIQNTKDTVRQDLDKCKQLSGEIRAEKEILKATGDYGDTTNPATKDKIDKILDEKDRTITERVKLTQDKLDSSITLIDKDVQKSLQALTNEDFEKIGLAIINDLLTESEVVGERVYEEHLKSLESSLQQQVIQSKVLGNGLPVAPLHFSDQVDNFEDKHGKQADQTLGKMKEIADVRMLLDNFRDELYINEYVLTQFSYSTNTKMNILYKFYNSEAEYICFGGENPSVQSFSQVYLVRLALDTAGYAAFSKAPMDPVLRFIYAMIMGAAQGFVDTCKLFLGQEVSVVEMHDPLLLRGGNPLAEVKVTYKDHLRLLLFWHDAETEKLGRILQVISARNNVDPSTFETVTGGHARVSIRLWFLPLGGFGDTSSGPFGTIVKDGRCYISKSVEYGY